MNRIVDWLAPLIAGLAVVALAPSAALAAAPEYAVLDHWKVPGAGTWDYLIVDAAGRRLFITRNDRVEVLDTATGKSIGILPGLKGAHGVALAEDLKTGYISNGKGDSVTVFALETLKILKEVPVPGHDPDAILYEPKGKHIFTFNGRSKNVTVLDAGTLAVLKTFAVADKPEFAADDGNGQIFVNIESEPGEMAVIDSHTLAVKATWLLPGCSRPSGLALDKLHHRLFSVCDDNVMTVTAADTGKQVATVKIGEGPDAVIYDPQHGLIFSSNGEGTMTVVHQQSRDRYTVAQTIKTQKGARTMAFDAASGRAYAVTSAFGAAPPATAEQPHPRPVPVPGTFQIIVLGYR